MGGKPRGRCQRRRTRHDCATFSSPTSTSTEHLDRRRPELAWRPSAGRQTSEYEKFRATVGLGQHRMSSLDGSYSLVVINRLDRKTIVA
jgi:hypothetical protein